MSAPTQVWEICPYLAGVSANERGKRRLMYLQFYGDDSGNDSASAYFVMAGLLAPAAKWAEFTDKWRASLNASPKIDYLKMKEANRVEGEFKGKGYARDDKVRALASVLWEAGPLAFSVSINRNDFNQVFRNRISAEFNNPYFCAVFVLIMNLGYWRINNPGAPLITLIFDNNKAVRPMIEAAWQQAERNNAKALLGNFVGPPQHLDDMAVEALQAADMVAWHVRRNLEIACGNYSEGTASAAQPILDSILGSHEVLGLGDLEKHRDMVMSLKPKGGFFPHEAEDIQANWDVIISNRNTGKIISALASGQTTVSLDAIPAKGLNRYLLLDRCDQVGTPHLHMKGSRKCLGAG